MTVPICPPSVPIAVPINGREKPLENKVENDLSPLSLSNPNLYVSESKEKENIYLGVQWETDRDNRDSTRKPLIPQHIAAFVDRDNPRFKGDSNRPNLRPWSIDNPFGKPLAARLTKQGGPHRGSTAADDGRVMREEADVAQARERADPGGFKAETQWLQGQEINPF